MQPGGKLRAWIETRGGSISAAFVGVPDGVDQPQVSRLPAIRNCASVDDARRWIDAEAAALGLPVEWVGGQKPGEHEG